MTKKSTPSLLTNLIRLTRLPSKNYPLMGVRYDLFKISSKIFICFFAAIPQLNILTLSRPFWINVCLTILSVSTLYIPSIILFFIIRIYIVCSISTDFRQASRIRYNYRTSAGHGFQWWKAEAFVKGWKNKK